MTSTVPIAARIVSQFSSGDASAVATKLALAQYGRTHDVQILNAFIAREHPDNRRFLADCERWFGRTIAIVRDEKYDADPHEVWRRKQYIVGQRGAPCSAALKRDVLDAWTKPDDVLVIGYTFEEQDRFNDWIDANPERRVIAPLIEHELSKQDCHEIVRRAGIKPSAMYGLGYNNANCIGCCKGGEGYWNKIRVDFPDVFEQAAQIQEAIGPGAFFFRNRKTKERFSLRQLDRNAGRHTEDGPGECGVFCLLAEREIRRGEAA